MEICLIENRLMNYKETLMALYSLNWQIAQELSSKQIYFYQSSFNCSDTIPLEYEHMIKAMNVRATVLGGKRSSGGGVSSAH